MGASDFLKSVDFRAFAVNVKTIALGKYLYQFGHAIWWSDMPMAVYTFLETYDFSGKQSFRSVHTKVAEFQVHQAISKPFARMQQLLQMVLK